MYFLLGLLVVLSFLVFVASFVWLIVSAIRKVSKKRSAIFVVSSLIATIAFFILFGVTQVNARLSFDNYSPKLGAKYVTVNASATPNSDIVLYKNGKYMTEFQTNDSGRFSVNLKSPVTYTFKLKNDNGTIIKKVTPVRSTKWESAYSSSVAISKAASSEYKKDSSEASSELAASSSSESVANSSSESAAKDPSTYQTGVTYDQLARTPDQYKGKKVSLTGKVIQTLEDSDATEIRLAVNGNYDDIVLVDIEKSVLNGSGILEDDLVTVGGTSKGTTSYKSTSGTKITVPYVVASLSQDKGTAPDNYGD